MRKGVTSRKFRDFLPGAVLGQYLVDVYLVNALQDGKLSVVGGEDGFEAGELVKEVRVVAEIVDAIGVEDYDGIVGQVLYEQRQEFLHVSVSAEPGPDDPTIDGLFPPLQLVGPLQRHLLALPLRVLHLLLRNEHRVHDDLRRVGLDCR